MIRSIHTAAARLAAIAVIACSAAFSVAAEDQQALIAVLKSDAPPAEKAITCKKLSIYGQKEAVPALAPLLADPELASWARIALEAIPDPAAGEALREALPKLQGRLLIGVMNSLGVRRDPQAVRLLAGKLKDTDPEIVGAAAEALGHIGGPAAARALVQAIAAAPEAARSTVAYGAVICAENLLAEGKAAEATSLYDAVRQANVPKQRLLEATRGAILARGSAGLPLLLEQLRSSNKDTFSIGLRTARDLPGRNVTEALAAELERLSSDWRLLLFMAVADRNDEAVLPTVIRVADTAIKPIRVVALSRLDRFHDPAAVPVLLKAVAEGDPDLTRAAKATLARMEGTAVDTAVLAELPKAQGSLRQTLIELTAQRRVHDAMPLVVRSANDADPAIRKAALETIGVLGTAQHAPDLVRLFGDEQAADERERIERALVAVCSRAGRDCLPPVLTLTRHSDAALRRTGLRVLAAIGGSDALNTVTRALEDPDSGVQDEAVSTLATWPNNWPDDVAVAEPLLRLAQSGQKVSHHVQGVRGYLHYLQEDKRLSAPEKLAKVNALLPSLQRPEEKRLAISAVSTFPTAGSLDLLASFAAEPAIAEEAYLALVNVATSDALKDAAADQRRKALQNVLEKSGNDATKKKAEEGLKKIR